jgi:hypothetical protein
MLLGVGKRWGQTYLLLQKVGLTPSEGFDPISRFG